ncbi:MAG: hypothetical protein ACRDST_12820 [Pseudonocardiaceae bacterium]
MLRPDRVELHAVVDSAEIPTLQQQPWVDTDSDGGVSAAEGRAWAAGECDELAGAVSATVDGEALRWAVRSAQVTYPQADRIPLRSPVGSRCCCPSRWARHTRCYPATARRSLRRISPGGGARGAMPSWSGPA